MKKPLLILPAMMCCLAAGTAVAAEPKANLIDYSNDLLIDDAGAKAILAANTPAKMWVVYPAAKFALVSQVEGGLTSNKTCVVTARVMLVTVTPATKAVLLRPQKMATTFDAVPSSSTDGCRSVAKDKLKEATIAVVSTLVKS